MTSRKDIEAAIQCRDNVTLRKMAQREEKEETRMLLNLLADVVEANLKILKKTA